MPRAAVTPPSDPRSARLVMRADRMLAQHRLLLDQIAVDAPLADVLDGLVRVIEADSTDGMAASVLVADAEGKHLWHGAAPSLPDAYNAALDGVEVGPAVGSCGTSAHRRETVVVTDIRTDPLWADYRDLAATLPYRSCWSIPLTYGGELLGTFAIYHPESRGPTEEERETAAMYARTASLVMQRHRVEQARDKARDAEARYARKLSRLATVSLALADADTVDEVIGIVLDHGHDVIRADGCVLGLVDDDAVRLEVSESLGPLREQLLSTARLDSTMPIPTVLRTGSRVILPDIGTGLAFSSTMQRLYDETRLCASATVPLESAHRVLGALSVMWDHETSFTRTQLDFIDGLAAQAAQSLQRVRERAVERRMVADTRQMSEALQRSMLSRPPQTERVAVAVRYQAAMEQEQIGGDWYDAFSTSRGAMMLVVGDVNGHDRDAAAAMGQLRSLLRGLAYDSDNRPAELLGRLDHAVRGLELDSLATAVVAQIPLQAQSDTLTLRLANAGHLPPLLRTADSTVHVLDGEPDLLLGLAVETARRDVDLDFAEGSTLVLYTDGLVERRGEHLDDGIKRLATYLEANGDHPIEQLCDEILRHMLPEGGEDDIALLVVRPRTEPTLRGGGKTTGATRTLEIANDPADVHRARAFVDDVCRTADLPGDVRSNAVLLTSELVTNAIVHAKSDAGLSVSADTSRVRVTVRDSDRSVPQASVPPDDATRGRGLVLVQLLASRWDTDLLAGGKTVWFELDAG